MSEKAMEAAARAVADYTGQRLPPHGDVRTCEGIAQAAITAYHAHLAAEGFVIVPVEPSEGMEDAGYNAHGGAYDLAPHVVWAAMIAARPQIGGA